MAKTAEVYADREIRCVMYGSTGNHPTLDDFKQNDESVGFSLTRFHVVLTRKRSLA